MPFSPSPQVRAKGSSLCFSNIVGCCLHNFRLDNFFLSHKHPRKNKVPSDQMDSFPTVMPERIRYHDLQKATNSFSEANLLGVGSFGSVCKRTFTDGTVVAVKVFNLQIEGAFKSFDTECEILRSLRHRNLAKVISSCSNIDIRALVLEYMPNGSRESWFYSQDKPLNPSQRLSIMIDVASAIEYLHHGYATPVVHCDLKPSNVLLDNAMVAHRELDQKESKFWKEPYHQASMWKPCADRKVQSASGGLNQQRVAVCNAVAVASLLNATLVIPKFLYSNVCSGRIQANSVIFIEETFMNIMEEDVNIVKELPSHLKSIDLEAIGSLVTDADLSKEATPDEYIKKILPILPRNGIVRFLGFGNRLGFDPLPSELQRLRRKCNFHALKFAPKIQKTGSLLVSRIRKYNTARSMLDKQLHGSFISKLRKMEDPALVAGLGFDSGTYIYLAGSGIYG
ncbi:Non-specific serine/threonine protein kinase [Handroanthus impetiginosus]|uniref:O-fucosyltransferase family protein n=1 Tax=Handroanthus impetiginosus TaxID=429701 RepID=A0A2G9I3Q2_9LAMI|nr:Non-specific serine/threonine protein kinase [Handroanthus impetiginosus]